MKPLRTRNDLLDLICSSGEFPSRACVTAIREDRAIVLGGFQEPNFPPSYITEVTSRHGKVWIIEVGVDDVHRKYLLRTRTSIPWKYWQGQMGRKTYSLIDGDQPIRCAANKERANGR